MNDDIPPDDPSDETRTVQQARADRLRAQINNYLLPSDGEEVGSLLPERETPRDFLHRRMQELDQEGTETMPTLSAPISLRSIPDLLADPVHNIAWLKEALQNAVRLEFATIPPYLCALWSINENDHPAQEAIKSVVMEEMLHMAIACNLLNAIGGTPVLTAPGVFPLYPGPLPGEVRPELEVRLARLSKPLLKDVLMEIEFPQNGPVAVAGTAATFNTVGDFYDAIAKAFEDIPLTLDTVRQLEVQGSFGELLPLSTVNQVLEKIALIKHQGEGSDGTPFEVPGDPPQLGHYYQFAEIEAGKRLIQLADGSFGFEGDPLPFPETFPMADVPKGGFLHPETAEFDRLYTNMLLKLEAAWRDVSKSALSQSIGMMFSLKGEAQTLMQIPVAPGSSETLGPCFRVIASP